MNCYLSRNYKGLSSAGNKAKTDIEQVMESMAFSNVGLKQTTYTNSIAAFFSTLGSVLKAPFSLHRGDVLVLQYPFKKYFSLVCAMAHARGAKVVVVIHDLGSFRRKKLTIGKEIKRLNHADYIIAHNEKMKGWLEKHGCSSLLGTLQIFDYLSETKAVPVKAIRQPYRVLYAGGLSQRKNRFLYEVGKYIHSFCFSLYGNGFEIDKAQGSDFFKYMGFVKSDDLIATAQGDFGLVWDGSSVSACTGDFGEYLQYNNPHKTSLYIRCELPIIIWSKAALADFVRQNHIGFCIDSLTDLESILASLTPEQYQEMKANVVEVSNRIAAGYYFRTAVTQAIERLR